MAVTTARPHVRDTAAWTYVSGLASALEGRLLTHRATLDLLNVGGLADILVRARQTLMGSDLAETTQPFALAESIETGYAAMVGRIGAASPTSILADLFLLPIEWASFRSFLRTRALDQERREVPGSSVPDAVWEQCWATPDVEPPLDLFAAAAAVIREEMPREERDQRLVDGITHVYEARDIRRTALEVRSAQVAEWFEAWLKQRLALAVLRCRFNGWGHMRAADALNDLGVGKPEIMALATPERRDWQAPFLTLGLPEAQAIGGDGPQAAIAIERLIDDAMTERTHAGRGVPFGPELVTAFLWGLRMEALNLRLIVTGVAAGLPAEAIARDIRRTYV